MSETVTREIPGPVRAVRATRSGVHLARDQLKRT
jgi:hypothetical protein